MQLGWPLGNMVGVCQQDGLRLVGKGHGDVTDDRYDNHVDEMSCRTCVDVGVKVNWIC